MPKAKSGEPKMYMALPSHIEKLCLGACKNIWKGNSQEFKNDFLKILNIRYECLGIKGQEVARHECKTTKKTKVTFNGAKRRRNGILLTEAWACES